MKKSHLNYDGTNMLDEKGAIVPWEKIIYKTMKNKPLKCWAIFFDSLECPELYPSRKEARRFQKHYNKTTQYKGRVAQVEIREKK